MLSPEERLAAIRSTLQTIFSGIDDHEYFAHLFRLAAVSSKDELVNKLAAELTKTDMTPEQVGEVFIDKERVVGMLTLASRKQDSAASYQKVRGSDRTSDTAAYSNYLPAAAAAAAAATPAHLPPLLGASYGATSATAVATASDAFSADANRVLSLSDIHDPVRTEPKTIPMLEDTSVNKLSEAGSSNKWKNLAEQHSGPEQEDLELRRQLQQSMAMNQQLVTVVAQQAQTISSLLAERSAPRPPVDAAPSVIDARFSSPRR